MAQLLAFFWLSAGQWLESRGMGAVAGDCYRLAGAKGGKRGAKSLWHLGRLEFANGQFQEALAAYRHAVELDPANAAIWCDFGIACREAGQFGKAAHCYYRALELEPSSLLALTHIGELHLVQGEADAALACFERVLDLSPLYHDALVKRIAALIECDKVVDAEQAARQAIEHYPDSADLHIGLGNALTRAGHKTKGLIAYKKALEIQPDNQEVLFPLAILQNDARMLKDSVEFIRRQITLKGESAWLRGLLASALQYSGELEEAEAICRKLLEQHPSYGPGWKTLASCTCARGDAAASIEYFKKALELRPEWDDIQSCIAFNSTYIPDLTAEAIFQCHLDWAKCHEAPMLERQYRHPPGTAPGKRLRIGYVSGDFFNHPVGLLMQGVLQQHNHGNFEIHCFSASGASDHITAILRASSDYWHQIELMPDEELAELVKTQDIDILVDLSGHTAGKRLKAFALKPAPIQATWIGYFHSTGMTSVDYFITDRYTTPQPSAQFFSEIPVRMPHSRFCYTPFDFAPEVSEPPFHKTGYVTFGSFNRLAKLTEPVVEAWSRIVANVPGAKLMIKDWGLFDHETAERLKKRFQACGLAPERLILRSGSNYLQMFEQYAEVDIALDPFPFNGGMTTLDSLWMGVPVVTLAGVAVVARQSTSMLSNLELEELIFPDVDSYIAGAVALALDKDRLATLRCIIRPKMSRSPLCDAEQFTADLEMLYRRMWQAWCRGEKIGPEIVPGTPVARKILPSIAYSRATDDHLLQLFQKRWRDNPSESFPDVRSDSPQVTQEKIEIISATRLSEGEFWNKSALGISLRRLAKDTRLVARIAFENQRGLPEVFNARIDSPDNHEILLFMHDDVWLDDYFLADHVIDGLKTFDVIGVAGNRRRLPNQPAWAFIDNEHTWDIPDNLSGCVAHAMHPFGPVSVYGVVPAECELLDGVFLAARKSRLRATRVQFDPRFDFHFYDMDFCRSARNNGLRLGTWPISLTHQSGGAFGNPDWKEQYGLYQEKWE